MLFELKSINLVISNLHLTCSHMKPVMLVLSFVFSAILIASGQMYSPPMTIKTPYGNVNTPGVYRPYTPVYGSSQQQTYFKRAKLIVHLNNDSVKNIRAAFDANSKQNTVTIKGKKGQADQVFKPADTKSVSRVFEGVGTLKGIPADSCWLFKIITGRINGYSNVPAYSEYSIIAIQDGEGAIRKLTKDNLSAMIPARSEKLERLLSKNKLIEAIKLFNNPPTK
jgi:hypothetical protein